MKITFPHMGNAYIGIKELLKGLQLEVIPPPPVTKRTLDLGVKYSPEFACLPLKINIGNFIEAVEKGADTIVMAGGWGPCRFGYYAQVEREILNGLGYDVHMIVLEAPDSKITELLKQVKALGQNVTFSQAWRAIRFAWHKISAVDEMEKQLNYYLARTVDKDRTEQTFQNYVNSIDLASTRAEVASLNEATWQALKTLPQHRQPVLKIGLIGEIYTIIESSTNCNVARYLGRLNAEVNQTIHTSDWVNDHLLGGFIKKSDHKHILQCSVPYLNYEVGGHGRETVGNAVHFARKKYDGIIQIAPLTCMPEIVAQTVLVKISDELNIPIMTLYFDEHSGTAGVYTRLEAFVDMLRRKNAVKTGPIQISV